MVCMQYAPVHPYLVLIDQTAYPTVDSVVFLIVSVCEAQRNVQHQEICIQDNRSVSNNADAITTEIRNTH
jgi:hypothetical protein